MLQVNISSQRHVSGMNLENVQSSGVVWCWNVDETVESSRAQDRLVDDVRPVCSADDYDVDKGLDPVHLCQQLAYHSLRDPAVPKAHSSPRNHRVKLVKEHYRRSSSTTLPEDFAYRLFRFAYPLTEEFRSFDRDEVGLALRRYCLGKHGLAAAWGSKEQNTLRRSYPNPLENLRLLDRPLDSLLKFLFDLGQPTYICPIH